MRDRHHREARDPGQRELGEAPVRLDLRQRHGAAQLFHGRHVHRVELPGAVLGIGIGGVAGYLGGRIDQLLMRFCDVFLTVPTIVLALFIIGVLGTGLVNVVLAIALYAVAVLFQFVTLPVEFDASKRAKQQLADLGLVASNEGTGVQATLNAAAWTYVAAALAAVAVLLYYLSMLSNR